MASDTTNYNFSNKTATANIKNGPGTLAGFLCATTSSGTIILYDDAATGTSTPITGTITPAAGTWYPLPVTFRNGLYVVIANTLNVTIVYA